MGKDKLKRFNENETFQNLFQPTLHYNSEQSELKGIGAKNSKMTITLFSNWDVEEENTLQVLHLKTMTKTL